MRPLHKYIIQSATSYLKYLESNNLGLEEIKILDARIHSNHTLLLYLERSLLTTDYLQLMLGEYQFDLDSIEEKEFNDATRVLKITFEEDYLRSIIRQYQAQNKKTQSHNATEDSIYSLLKIDKYNKEWQSNLKLFADLKFLVKNIKTFCEQDSLHIDFPATKPLKLKIPFDSHISLEQQEAIKGIFSNPISYIWGISGSGKTQVVLFSALLNLITQDKKALILAPTNTALEQIFISLIRQCDKRGIRRNRFLRLGMPSSDFLQSFPEVCVHNEEKEESGSTKMLFQIPNLKERMQDSLVIGITLDSFVKRYQILSQLDFAHIFLDECAFSPLIKLIAPLHLNIPMTLLGDHKQLMPICLMDDKTIKDSYHEVCLWNLNALFLEEMIKSHKTLCTKNNYDEIQFHTIAHYTLTTTHRYGNNLAQILNNFVYHNGLSGVGLQTQIYYIDSKGYGSNYTFKANENRNESEAEANAINELLLRNNLAEYAVLTPFRHQQQLLVKKGINRNRVFTIHKSQGKEFDTIILSPVKLSHYMTNSHNKAALFALNVAVSRLKKELIIVCDYAFWIKQQRQFISSLLQIAKPYPTMRNNVSQNNAPLPF